MDEPRITDATITQSYGRARIVAELDDGEVEGLFSWYVDELSFTASDVIGLTVAEARTLHFERDRAYLQS